MLPSPSSSTNPLSTMSLPRFLSPSPKPPFLLPQVSFPSLRFRHCCKFKLSFSPHHFHPAISPFHCSCTPSSTNSPENGGFESEEREFELRECVSEILLEFGVSVEDSKRIALNSPKYGKVLRDAVRDLDELSMWGSWMKVEGEEKGEVMVDLSFKEKVRRIAMEKGDDGKIAYLESVGLSLSSSVHLARVLKSEPLPSVMHKVKYVKDIFFSGSNDEKLVGKLARRMMFYLSLSVDEDVQQTLSFFEKVEARRGGLDMLGSSDTSFRLLIESFPRLLQLSVESNLKPMIKFMENIGIPRQRVGTVLLLFPPLLFLDIEDGVWAGLQPFEKIGALDKDLGRILMKYPWVLSKSIRSNYDKISAFLDSRKVPEASINQAIMDMPLLLGCSADNLKPMVEKFYVLDVRATKLGKVIATSPQLLLQRSEEFQKVVSFVQDLGFEKENIGKILVRCPEIFAASVENTLQKKVEFLSSLGISKHQIPRVIKKYPELFVSDMDTTVMPRLTYLMNCGLSEREIATMVTRFSPLLGYSIQEVLRPKVEFLLNTMGKPMKDVVEYPRYFSYSLDKKIKPRFFMLRSMNINCSLKDMLAKNDDEFSTEYLGIRKSLVSIR